VGVGGGVGGGGGGGGGTVFVVCCRFVLCVGVGLYTLHLDGARKHANECESGRLLDREK